MHRPERSVCLITGATHGIGRATAEALAHAGAEVIVHGRNAALVESVRRSIERKNPGAAVSGIVADFDSLAEVRGMARAIQTRCDRLDVLVNNAGTIRSHRELSRDGFERQFAINHLAPFLLTNLLLELLQTNAPARVVTVASRAHRRVPGIDLDDLNFERRRYNTMAAYATSKLANVLFSNELARRSAAARVTANALHPGVVATNLFGNLGVLGSFAGLLARPLLRSPARGAATSIYLASAPEVEGVTGAYFVDCRKTEPSTAALDTGAGRRLWEVSEQLVGLAAD
jgi:retinol dehydrogenase 12